MGSTSSNPWIRIMRFPVLISTSRNLAFLAALTTSGIGGLAVRDHTREVASLPSSDMFYPNRMIRINYVRVDILLFSLFFCYNFHVIFQAKRKRGQSPTKPNQPVCPQKHNHRRQQFNCFEWRLSVHGNLLNVGVARCWFSQSESEGGNSW